MMQKKESPEFKQSYGGTDCTKVLEVTFFVAQKYIVHLCYQIDQRSKQERV